MTMTEEQLAEATTEAASVMYCLDCVSHVHHNVNIENSKVPPVPQGWFPVIITVTRYPSRFLIKIIASHTLFNPQIRICMTNLWRWRLGRSRHCDSNLAKERLSLNSHTSSSSYEILILNDGDATRFVSEPCTGNGA
ncbi:hypothetical protein PIB30_073647 [Stylosanthes scabra]|uniref:Uncharacterized protein n=1 Tax=Stylosanthes scabra TaxID=79078 RepID=A0ABU6SQB9_9FABA|nr:hypothetical protein [Stylosanthes scabra]